MFRFLAFFGSLSFAAVAGSVTYSFNDVVTIGPSERADVMAIIDLDGDDQLDVVMGMEGWRVPLSSAIKWMQGEDRGTFFRIPAVELIPNGENIFLEDDGGGRTLTFWMGEVFDLKVADIDGDGSMDVVAALHATETAILALINDGTGTAFQPRIILPSARLQGPNKTIFNFRAENIEIADMNGDGSKDIIASVAAYNSLTEPPENMPGMLLYLENDGSGYFSTRVLSDETKQNANLALADYDGNGSLDIAVLSMGRSVLWIFKNDGCGNFVGSMVDVSATTNRAIGAGDIDMDGDIDIVCLNGDRLTAYFNNGDATFEKELLVTSAWIWRKGAGSYVLVHDVDGDGLNDIVAGPRFTEWGPCWFQQTEPGQFVHQNMVVKDIVSMNSETIVFVDIDGDGTDDLIVSEGSHINAYLGRETGGQSSVTTDTTPPTATPHETPPTDNDPLTTSQQEQKNSPSASSPVVMPHSCPLITPLAMALAHLYGLCV